MKKLMLVAMVLLMTGCMEAGAAVSEYKPRVMEIDMGNGVMCYSINGTSQNISCVKVTP